MTVVRLLGRAFTRSDREGLVNVTLRSMTLAGRLGLTVLLARGLSTADVGYYGAIAGGIAIGVILLGAEFYQHTFRGVAGADPDTQRNRARSQAALQSMGWLLVSVAAIAVWALGVSGVSPFGWLTLLLLGEHVSQELVRLLTSLGASTRANVLQLFRQAAWVPLLALWWTSGHPPRLEQVWYSWLSGCVVAIVYGLSCLDRMWGGLRCSSAVDWGWVRTGLPVALRYTVAVGCLTAIPLVGRYALLWWVDAPSAGLFTISSTLTNPIQTLAETGVLAVLFPQVLAARNRGDVEGFHALWNLLRRRMLLSVAVLTIAIGTAALVVQRTVLGLVTTEATLTVILQSLMTGALALAALPQVLLFVAGRDREILACAIVGLAATVVLSYPLARWGGAAGATLATLGGVVLLAVSRMVLAARIPPPRSSSSPA